ncbi:MAG TPA: DUF2878 domain-containing protein [Pseudomonadales bacterium]|jgi:hypothetical protein|nr:DUF2878 domain-containing protein [Pseudomonadales bacterium]
MTNARFLNAIAYQCGWLACVAGGNAWALPAGALILALHGWLMERSARGWAVIAVAALLGLAMDLGWQQLGLLEFHGTLGAGIPPWLVVLWLLFATTFAHSLAWLHERLALGALLGAVLGPLSYVAGVELGAATTRFPLWQLALAMAPAWALLLPLLLFLARAPRAVATEALS